MIYLVSCGICVKELIFFVFVYFTSYFSSLKFNHKISYYEKSIVINVWFCDVFLF